jgi:endo-1,4-beta-xylanase
MKFNIMLSSILVMLLIAFFIGCMDDQATSPVQQGVSKQAVATKVPQVVSLEKTAATASTNYYQCWKAGGGVSCTNGSGGNYQVKFSNCSDFVAGKGYSSGSHTMSWSGSCSGCKYFGVYGWCTSPLTEYYIGRSGGTGCGSYSTSKGNYTLNTVQCNGANIQGSGNFHQYNCSGSNGSGINTAEHFTGWSKLGHAANSPNYTMVASEAWGGASGSANVTVN